MRLIEYINDGTVVVSHSGSDTKLKDVYKVADGKLIERKHYSNKVESWYKSGRFNKTYDDDGRLTEVDFYAKGSVRSRHGVCWKETTFLKTDGVFSQRVKRGKVLWEKFVYSNGSTAFLRKGESQKDFKVYWPDGSLYRDYPFIGNHFHYYLPYNVDEYVSSRKGEPEEFSAWDYTEYFRSTRQGTYAGQIKIEQSRHEKKIWYKNRQLAYFTDGKVKEWFFPNGQIMRRSTQDFLEEYDRKGNVKNKGNYVNRQKEGEWVEAYETKYYISGVSVEKKLFHVKPEEMDGREILRLDNAQLRASLLKKMGYERLIMQVNGEVINKKDDMELIAIANPSAPSWSEDKVIHLLKVKCPSTGIFYTLRVPPTIKECEPARQWTFGVNDSGDRNQHLAFTKET